MKLDDLIKWFRKAKQDEKSGKVTVILHEGGIRQAKIEEEIKSDS